MRFRKSRTAKLVEVLERAVLRDLTAGRMPTGWLTKRHKDQMRAVSIDVGPNEVNVRLEPESALQAKNSARSA